MPERPRSRRKDAALTRVDDLTRRERLLASSGVTVVAGIDEAGRGALAGPVVAGCVVFEAGTWFPGVDDSKRLSPKRRNELYDRIMDAAAGVGVGIADVETIERINVLEATRVAACSAFAALGIMPQHVFSDALALDLGLPVSALAHADATIYSVAAASIVAKVTRDRIMIALDEIYPHYGFARHKGYGTAEHRQAIRQYGACAIHRTKFLRKILRTTDV